MRLTLLPAMAAIILSIAACGGDKSEEWPDEKDNQKEQTTDGKETDTGEKDKEEPGSGESGETGSEGTGSGGETGTVNTEFDRWSALADSCTFVLVENYLNKNRGTFWSTVQNVEHSSSNIYWQQAHAMDVLLYSYRRIRESNPTLAKTYLGYFRKWYENDANNYNNTHDKEGDYGGFFNVWTDDMAWICLTLLRMTEFTGTEMYANTAKEVYDHYIWARVSSCEKGTCLPWTSREEDKTKFNACTNTPSCLVSALLYNKFREQPYLDNAIALYKYNINNMPDEERVEEPPLSYTQGTMAEAARVLFHITGEKAYMEKSAKLLKYGLTSKRTTNNGILRSEGKSMDQSIFKAVFIPYAVNYVLDKDADSADALSIREKLLQNAEALDRNLKKTTYPNMYCNYYWGKAIEDETVVMGAQVSGASLIENVARMFEK